MMLRKLSILFSLPVVLAEYFNSRDGAEYGVGPWQKLRLAWRMYRNTRRIQTASHVLEHLAMASAILRVPRSDHACIVECGTFKGGSAANLSLVAELCGRQIHIFDSFAGLPDPGASDDPSYQRGDYCGRFAEVTANIERCGAIEVCTFHRGYFSETLPDFGEPCILAFLDVDLVDSLTSCFKYLWPLLQSGCYLFSHEARDPNIIRAFFDDAWWQDNLNMNAPGLVGSGTGLGLIPHPWGFGSNIGYAIKGVTAPASGPDTISLPSPCQSRTPTLS
jgi:Methyltransferase domain